VWGKGEDRLYTCTVVTEPAVGALAEIHQRMPFVLPRERWADWLDPAREDVADLVTPTPPDLVETLELRPVSTLVNNVANNGPELEARVESVSEPADQPALF
jgi:putative SOS response-associated peptidase YedK